MKKIVILGIGDFADILTGKIEENGADEVWGYAVNKQYITSDSYNQRKLIPFEDIENYVLAGECRIYLGVIGKRMFEDRERLFYELRQKGYRVENFISPTAAVKTEVIGQGNIIMENAVIEKHCKIGNGNIIWPNVVLPHHNAIGDFNNLSPSVSFSGYARIGNRCFIGNNACLNNHVSIQNCALVGGGVFVAKDLDEYQVLVSSRSYVLEGKISTDFK